jgi:hypothetical protein
VKNKVKPRFWIIDAISPRCLLTLSTIQPTIQLDLDQVDTTFNTDEKATNSTSMHWEMMLSSICTLKLVHSSTNTLYAAAAACLRSSHASSDCCVQKKHKQDTIITNGTGCLSCTTTMISSSTYQTTSLNPYVSFINIFKLTVRK